MRGYGVQVVRKLPQCKNRISTKIYEGRLLFETVWIQTGLHLLKCRVLRGVQNLGLAVICESVNITALQAYPAHRVNFGTGKHSDISYYPVWIVLSAVHDGVESVPVRPSAERFAALLAGILMYRNDGPARTSTRDWVSVEVLPQTRKQWYTNIL